MTAFFVLARPLLLSIQYVLMVRMRGLCWQRVMVMLLDGLDDADVSGES